MWIDHQGKEQRKGDDTPGEAVNIRVNIELLHFLNNGI